MVRGYLELMIALGRDAVHLVPLLGPRGVDVDAVVGVPNLNRRRKVWLAQVVWIRLLVKWCRLGERDGLWRRLRHLLEPQLPWDEPGNFNSIGADAASCGEVLELVGRLGRTDHTIPGGGESKRM